MTPVVIDTSALIKFVLPEDHLAAEINIPLRMHFSVSWPSDNKLR